MHRMGERIPIMSGVRLCVSTCSCSSVQRQPGDDGKLVAVDGTVLGISVVVVDKQPDHIQVTLLARCGQHPVQQVSPQTGTWEGAREPETSESRSV